MPSALETLVKVLKLEQNTGYQDKAVIGGLGSFASEWQSGAHAQAKKPEHHALVDELVELLHAYHSVEPAERHAAIKYMLDRITGRVPPPGGALPKEGQVSASSAPSREEPKRDSPAPRPDDPSRAPRPPRPLPERNPADRPERDARPDRERPPRREDRSPPPRRESYPSAPPPAQARWEEPEPGPTSQPEPYVQEPVMAGTGPTTIEDMLLEPIAVALGPDPLEIRPPRAKAPPPRRRRDNRGLDQKREVLRALTGPVSDLYGIGPRLAEKLATLEISTVEDLVYTFPRRYDDYTTMKPLNRLRPGELVSVAGTVRSVALIHGKRNIDVFNVVIDDGAGSMSASFFNQPYLRGKLDRGMQVVFSGKTELYLGRVVMNNPHWEFVDQDALTTRAIVPVYPLTASLSPPNMRKATDSAMNTFGDALPDIMPDSVLDRVGLGEWSWAIRQMHRPDSMDMLEHARERLMFDDLVLLQLGVMRNRRQWQALPADALPVEDSWVATFAESLPFALTGAQTRAIEAIRADMAHTIPMNRLLQGDVGAGKTVVAAAAMAMAVANGHQAALMAPTSILAEQHYRNLSNLFASLPFSEPITVRLLTGATPAKERAETLWGLGEGTVQIAIGTHALIQDDVNFWKLGMVVIDEQHRFGVEQRGRLRGKGTNPHALVMTATPIPRTLALTMYADLDLTVLDEMPPGRTPIETHLFLPRERERAYGFIRSQVERGQQAFIIFPLIEASDSESMADVRSATEEYERLSSEIFPHFRLGLLHGRMSSAEKDAVMSAFSQGQVNILVSTSVVEVGIDVPNATVMMIEGANRFGLAQLHQFRGRVGRGQHASYCILIADANDAPDNPRLRALEGTTDGFKLAEIDWQLRGAGELLGTRQSGQAGKLAEFISPHIVELAQKEARTLYVEDALLKLPEHTLLKQRLEMVYGAEPGTEVS